MNCNNCDIRDFYIKVGIEKMKGKLLQAAENGTPIEIDGRAWFIITDQQHMKDIIEDIIK